MEPSIDQIVQKVWEVIMTHSQSPYRAAMLHRFETWELQYIPLRYLIKYAHPNELKVVWCYLPESYKENKELQVCLPCLKHYNTGRTHIDGSPPRQRDCSECISHKN